MIEGMAFVFVAIALAMPLVGSAPSLSAADILLRAMIILDSRRAQHRSTKLAPFGHLLRHIPRAVDVLRDAIAGCDLLTVLRPSSDWCLGGNDVVTAVINAVVS